jgi:tRNA pseudouridine38-40 synthase
VQSGLRTVQGELELWLSRLLAEPITLTVAGRTDAGVHARGQVAHFDTSAPLAELIPAGDGPSLCSRLGRVLPEDVIVRRLSVAPAGFDARFSASWRRYVYRLCDGLLEPLARNQVVKLRSAIDVEAANAAAQQLIGLHDFAAFCKPREGATTIRELRLLEVRRVAELIEVDVRADAFAHSMVRSLVGALLEVGNRRRDAEWLAAMLGRGERCGEIPVMPAKGLTLEEVGYPPAGELAARAEQARNVREIGG